VTYYNFKNGVSKEEKETYKSLWISMIAALFMVFGVAQSNKSLINQKNKQKMFLCLLILYLL
jgi:hypothetical protein